jgi:hypothetical protein
VPGCRAPIRSKGKQRICGVSYRKRSIETQTAGTFGLQNVTAVDHDRLLSQPSDALLAQVALFPANVALTCGFACNLIAFPPSSGRPIGHITGTDGKGRVSALLPSILQASPPRFPLTRGSRRGPRGREPAVLGRSSGILQRFLYPSHGAQPCYPDDRQWTGYPAVHPRASRIK